MNYNIKFQNGFVMHRIYVLDLCYHFQLKIVNIMQCLHCCPDIYDQFNLVFVFLFFFFCLSFHKSCQNLKQEFILKAAL